jgi:hypothetical protein
MKVHDHLCRHPAGVGRIVRKHIRVIWPEAVKLLSTCVYPLRNWPHFAERVQEARSGQLALDGSRSRMSTALTPLYSSSIASGLKFSLLNTSAMSSHGSSGSLSSSSRSRGSVSRRRAVAFCPSIKAWNSRQRSGAVNGGDRALAPPVWVLAPAVAAPPMPAPTPLVAVAPGRTYVKPASS